MASTQADRKLDDVVKDAGEYYDYIRKKDAERYRTLIDKLGIRR